MSSNKFHQDILDIDLNNNGSLHRSFMNKTIGLGDSFENRYGVRLFFDGDPVNLDSASCIGLFMAPNGQNILISGQNYTYAGNNLAYVQLPQACYNVEGQFSLAIKIVDSPITGTMRIIDGVVANTGSGSLSHSPVYVQSGVSSAVVNHLSHSSNISKSAPSAKSSSPTTNILV